ILVTSIFGVEINREACYVTEFSLLLTLLSYVTPPQLEEHDSFKFPDLHNNNIFNCDFFDPDSSFTNRSASFRWIVGNPPWQELDRNDPHSKHCRAYINKLPSGSVFDLRIHEAFVWRALEFADYSSAIGLIILATSLVNSESEQFRRRLFSSISVSRITNFSNFSFRLFPTAGQPATV
ncbi:MAG: hypothetical protein K8R88_13450, partial [Armatimonadetes bacterium]|nr:hypothetical protein [Armatimonadota bacterium]